jgi:hypothetical protein
LIVRTPASSPDVYYAVTLLLFGVTLILIFLGLRKSPGSEETPQSATFVLNIIAILADHRVNGRHHTPAFLLAQS